MPTTVVCALIVRRVGDQSQIFMTKRAANLDFLPGAYELPGGHVEPGETDEQALCREIKEELNLEVRVGELCDSFPYTSPRGQEIEAIYFATLTSPIEDIKLKKDEVDSFRWVTEQDLESIVVPTKLSTDNEIPIVRKAFLMLSDRT